MISTQVLGSNRAGQSGIAGSGLPAGGTVGDGLVWDGAQWVASHEARAYNAMLGDTGPVESAVQGTAVVILGTAYVYRLAVRRSAVSAARTLWYIVSTAQTVTTLSLAVFDSTGAQLGATSANQNTNVSTTGNKSDTVGSFPLTAGQDVYVEAIAIGGTGPTFRGSNGGSLNVGIAAAPFRVNSNGTGLGAIPTPIVPASLVSSNVAIWFGIT